MILKTVFRAQADKTPGTTWSCTCWHFKGHQVALHTFPSRCMEIAITYSSNPRSFLSVMDATDVFFPRKTKFHYTFILVPCQTWHKWHKHTAAMLLWLSWIGWCSVFCLLWEVVERKFMEPHLWCTILHAFNELVTWAPWWWPPTLFSSNLAPVSYWLTCEATWCQPWGPLDLWTVMWTYSKRSINCHGSRRGENPRPSAARCVIEIHLFLINK